MWSDPRPWNPCRARYGKQKAVCSYDPDHEGSHLITLWHEGEISGPFYWEDPSDGWSGQDVDLDGWDSMPPIDCAGGGYEYVGVEGDMEYVECTDSTHYHPSRSRLYLDSDAIYEFGES